MSTTTTGAEKKGEEEDQVEGEGEEVQEEDEEEDVVADPYANEPRNWAAVSNFLEEEAKRRALAMTTSVASGTAPAAGASELEADGEKAKQQQQRQQQHEDEDEDDDRDALGILSAAQMHSRRKDKAGASQLKVGSDGFDATAYLATVHSRTPFDVLQLRGVAHLEGRLSRKAEAIKRLVRSNFELFIRCKDTVDVMHSVVVDHEIAGGGGGGGKGGGAGSLAMTYEALEKDAQRVFDVLLSRKKEADHIRALLFALDRSKFLFRLPSILRQAVARGDDEKVLQVHARARELLAESSNSLFQRVLAECDAVAEGFRQQLFKVLEDPSARMGDVERVIGVLGQLGMGSSTSAFASRHAQQQQQQQQQGAAAAASADPVRYYLEFHSSRLKAALEAAAEAYTKKRLEEEQQIARRRRRAKGSAAEYRKPAHVRAISEILQRGLPPIYGLVAMFAASPEAAEPDAQEAAAARKWAGRIPELLGLQKQRVARVLCDDGTWAAVKVHRTQTAAVLFQQMMDHVRGSGAPRAKDADYALVAVTPRKGKEEAAELKPYDRPYSIHKKWGKADGNYFAFKRRSAEEVSMSASSASLPTAEGTAPPESKGAAAAGMPLSREAVQRRLAEISAMYAKRVLQVFDDADDAEGESLVENYESQQQVVLEISRCRQELRAQGLPGRVWAPVAECLAAAKSRLVKRLCEECVQGTEVLHTLEDWAPAADGGPHTGLPGQFSGIVGDLLRLLDAALDEDDPLRQDVGTAFASAIVAFVDAMHHLVFGRGQVDSRDSLAGLLGFSLPSLPAVSAAPSSASTSGLAAPPRPHARSTAPPENVRLLRVLANCQRCRVATFPEIIRILGFDDDDEQPRRIGQLLGDLEELIVTRYVAGQVAVTAAAVRTAVCDSGFDWGDSPEPARVPDFALSFLLHAARVHADVREAAPRLAPRILRDLLCQFVQAVRDALGALPCVGFFGSLNLLSAIEFVRASMPRHDTPRCSALCDRFREALEEVVSAHPDPALRGPPARGPKGIYDTPRAKEVISKLIEASKSRTTILFACFLKSE